MTAVVFEDLTWREDALEAIEQLAAKGQPFDSYDLSQAGLRQPPHHNMWGRAFRTASERGIITAVGAHRSKRKSRSGGSCYVWVGKGAA